MKTFDSYFSGSNNIEDSTIIGVNDDDEKIAITLFSTENIIERTGGLLRLSPLAKDQGLLINKCNSIHTFGMKYSLDVVYLNRHYKVVKLVENIKPRRMSLCLKARHTLELLSGEISRLKIKDDMTLSFDEK